MTRVALLAPSVHDGDAVGNDVLGQAAVLEWLGHEDTIQGAAWIRQAVEAVLADPAQRTPDPGGIMTTRQMGEAILADLRAFAHGDSDADDTTAEG